MNNRMKAGPLFMVFFIIPTVAYAQAGDLEFDSLLEKYTTTWNTRDGDDLAAYFTADADFIMGSLPLINGREAIGQWWNTYFSRIDENRKGEFKLLSLRAITPDVRIVNISSKTYGVTRFGEELETRLARGTWVLVKRNETWLIAAMRGLPAVGEQRLRPGVDR